MALNNYQDANFTPSITPSDVRPSMGTYNTPQSFRFWCQKVLPLVYDDSLSYYELLCKVVDYLNKTMEDVNTAVEDVTNLNSAFGSLESYVNASEVTIIQAYNDLQDYVNTYFNNLDVQEEINNKLDIMAEDGSLDALILPYFNQYVEQTNDIIDERFDSQDNILSSQNDKIAILEGRMDTFSSLPTGSTSGDAELLDIRVASDGTIYPTAGDAVRAQNNILKNSILVEIEHGITWEQGSLSSQSASPTASTTRCRTNNYIQNDGTLGVKIPVPNGYKISCYLFSTNSVSGYTGRLVDGWSTNDFTITPSSCAYFKLVIAYTDDANIAPENLPTINYISEYATDKTLTLENKPADAKATGDMFNKTIKTASYDGGNLLANQTTNTKCRLASFSSVEDAPNGISGLNIYGWLTTVGSLNKLQILNITVDGFPCIFVRTYNNAQATWTTWKTFAGSANRGYYTAFGASTTEGRVHHYTGNVTTVSQYDYPSFVGRLLNFSTNNLAVGSTGLICRGTPNTAIKENVMDRIYHNDSILQNSNLITIQFGYGNDRHPIINDNVTEFSIGEWNDYYPYDEEGYHPFSEDSTTRQTTDIQTMINKGATLLGCLNWCIKWLSEKYPKAQLIIIYGAPSANNDYPVHVINNPTQEGVGNPKYKLSVAARDMTTGLNQKIHELADRLNINLIDEFNQGNPFNYYNMHATNADGTYAVFSTTGTPENKTWNSHPNDTGYLMYARYTAGKITSLYQR